MLGTTAIHSTTIYARRLSERGLHRAAARQLFSALKRADPEADVAIEEAWTELIETLLRLGDRKHALILSALLDEIRNRRAVASAGSDRAPAAVPQVGR